MDIQPFPKMLFSVIHGHCIVQNEEELQVKLEEGWQTEPAKQFSEASIREKIAYHLAELERWEESLEAYRNAPVEKKKEPVGEEKLEDEPAGEPTSTMTFLQTIPEGTKLTPQEGTPVMKVSKPKLAGIKPKTK